MPRQIDSTTVAFARCRTFRQIRHWNVNIVGSGTSISLQAMTISAWQFGQAGIARPKEAISLSLVMATRAFSMKRIFGSKYFAIFKKKLLPTQIGYGVGPMQKTHSPANTIATTT